MGLQQPSLVSAAESPGTREHSNSEANNLWADLADQ
jgi:hypothetical protein